MDLFWMRRANYDGFQGDNGKIRNNANITDILRNYDISTGPEGAHGDIADVVVQWHYTTMQDYSITEWGGGGHSSIIDAINAQNPNSLDGSIFKPYRDKVNAVNGVTQDATELGNCGGALFQEAFGDSHPHDVWHLVLPA